MNKQNKELNNPLAKVGRALLKYFKPVRTAPPHIPGQKLSTTQTELGTPSPATEGFRLLKFKKEKPSLTPNRPQTDEATLPVAKENALPEKAPSSWIELVVSLLTACRRLTHAMKKKMGANAYQKSIIAGGQQKLQTMGSIIDTTSDKIDIPDEEKYIQTVIEQDTKYKKTG